MPTIVQSVGTSTGKNGKEASLPRHQKTTSPTPAPTESIAIIGLPYGLSAASSGSMTSSLRPVSKSFLTVATTVPITRANCIDNPFSGQPQAAIACTHAQGLSIILSLVIGHWSLADCDCDVFCPTS